MLDGSTAAVVATVPVGVNPQAVGVDAATGTAYVSNVDDGTVSVVTSAAAPARADLAVAMAAPARVRRHEAFTATVTVTDHGPDAAGTVTATLGVPCGLRVTGTGGGTRSGHRLLFTLPTLASGATRTWTVTLVARHRRRHPVVLTAAVTGATVDPVPDDDTATAAVRVG